MGVFKLDDKFLKMDKDYNYFRDSLSISFSTTINAPTQISNMVNAGAYVTENRISFSEPFNEKMLLGQGIGVLYHELGHCINHLIYKDMGRQQGMISGALHEGLADLHTAMMLGYEDVFRGYFLDSATNANAGRHLKNTLKLDIDDIGQVHFDGQIISGAMWDFGELTSFDLMAELMHYTRYATPDAENRDDNGTAFTQ
jgi:hypothetical protein